MRITLTAALGGAALATLAACDQGGSAPPTAETGEPEIVEPVGPTLSEVLAENDDLGTFARLIEQANMGPFIEGADSYTLFAPTDAAFEAVPESTLTFLTDPENASTLRAVLGYHLLRNRMESGALINGIEGGSDGEASMTTSNNYTLAGRMGEPEAEGEAAPVVLVDANGDIATIVTTDIDTGNGIVHKIDAVLMPPQ